MLKAGATPTMSLTEFSMKNENFKEENHLQRIVGAPEDLQCVHDYSVEHSNNKSCKKSSPISLNATIVSPTRESRTNKRRHEKVELEKEQKLKKLNEDAMCNIQDLHTNFQ